MEAIRQSVDFSALVIAVIGALLSIASALYFTSRKISAEFQYRRRDLSNIYAEKILAERLQRYPEIWAHLSSYSKILRQFPASDGSLPRATVLSLKDFTAVVQQWDSKYAFILSTNAALASHALYVVLRDVLLKRTSAGGEDLITRDEFLRINPAIARYELALRTDIGIFEVEEMEQRTSILTYADVIKRSRWKAKLPASRS